jgi:hypothetical protein
MRRSRALATAQAALVILFATCACSLDDRQLVFSQPQGGSTNTSASGGADGGAADAPDAGGTSTGGTNPNQLVDGCADLDTDSIADCTQTLLTNPSFASDTSDWTADANATLAWEPKNALKDAPSGSLRLAGSGARASASQCVAVNGQRIVIAYANAFVPRASDAAGAGQAQLEVSYFDAADCSGERAGFFETPVSTAVDAWVIVQAGGVSLAGTRSVLVTLVGLKSTTGTGVDVYFDNVMLKTREP